MKKIMLSSLLYISAIATYAAPSTIPFTNYTLNPNQTINASYNFGAYHVIFCYENQLQTVGYFTWTYKGQLQTSSLPIFLVTNSQYTGSLADPVGSVFIKNTTSASLIVSCQFAL